MKSYWAILSITFLLLLFAKNSFAQIDTTAAPSVIVENIVEQIVQSQEQEEYDFDEIFDDLLFFYRHKINLNSATREELEKLHFLNDIQIDAIIRYREKTGEFISIYELNLIPELSEHDIQLLVPFVTVEKVQKIRPIKLKNALKYGRNQLFIRDKFILQKQRGYTLPDSVNTRYLGNRHKFYMRYKFTYRNRILAGVTMEKDAGEQFFRGAQKYGFDFYSAHVEINQLTKHINRLVIGDYLGKFGQGLVIWNGFSMGKSAFVLDVRRRPQGLRKYSSTNENLFFRGTGITVQYGKFYITTFGSYKKIDANLQYDTLNSQTPEYASSLLNTGYHRTPSEIAKRHTVNELVGGFDLTYKGDHWHWGLTSIAYKWSVPLVQPGVLYRLNPISRNYGGNLGFNWFYLNHRFSFFGEIATDVDANLATVMALTLPMYYRLEAVVLYRYFSPSYFSFYGNAFSESTSPQNEQGFYTGLKILPAKKWEISLYFDHYQFPWMRYRLYEPQAWGNDIFAQIDFAPSRRMSMYLRFRTELKPQNLTADSLISPLVLPTVNTRLRYHFNYQLNDQILLRSRIEFSRYVKDSVQHGFMIFQDIRYRPQVLPLTFYWRFVVFDAPYNCRIYAYENDVLYAFSVPAYFYQGFRTYFLVKYQINKHLTFWLKYAQTTYTDRNVISPGSLNEIDGNTKSELKFQLRFKF